MDTRDLSRQQRQAADDAEPRNDGRAVPAAPKDPTFHEFACGWFEGHRHELADSSVDLCRWTLTHHLLPHFEDHRLSQITVAEVDRYKAAKIEADPVAVGAQHTRR